MGSGSVNFPGSKCPLPQETPSFHPLTFPSLYSRTGTDCLKPVLDHQIRLFSIFFFLLRSLPPSLHCCAFAAPTSHSTFCLQISVVPSLSRGTQDDLALNESLSPPGAFCLFRFFLYRRSVDVSLLDYSKATSCLPLRACPTPRPPRFAAASNWLPSKGSPRFALFPETTRSRDQSQGRQSAACLFSDFSLSFCALPEEFTYRPSSDRIPFAHFLPAYNKVSRAVAANTFCLRPHPSLNPLLLWLFALLVTFQVS